MENLPKSVQIVLRRLEEDGREAWCVGGCVRVPCWGELRKTGM